MMDATMGSRDQGAARKLLRSYKVFCVAFAGFLLLYAGVRVALLRAGHQDEARTSFQSVRAGASAAMAAYDARDDGYFSATMRELAENDPRLELLALYDRAEEVYYFFARSGKLFLVPPAPTANLLTVPPYRSPALSTLRLISAVGTDGGSRRLTVEAMYRVLGAEDVHRLAKEIVYVLLVFLIVTATVLLLVTSLSTDVVRAVRRPVERPEAVPPADLPPRQPRAAPSPAPVPSSPSAERAAPGAASRPVDGTTGAREPEAAEPGPAATAPRAGTMSFYNESTGLVYQDYLASRLRSEAERAAASDQDMVLAVIALDGWDAVGDQEAAYVAVATRLRETFPYRDLVFEQPGGFAVIVPDTNLDKALERLEEFRLQVAASPVGDQALTVSVGIAARNGRLVSEETLLKEGEHALAKARRDGANQVVAFRADPDKFRRVLAS